MQSNVYIESLECPGSMESGKSAQGNVEAQCDDRWHVCICPVAPVYLYVCLCAPVDIRFDTLLVETCLTSCCEKVRADACRGRGHLFVYMISFMCAIRYICLCVYISILLSVYLSRYHVYTYTCMCRYVHMYVLSFVRMYACK